MKMTMHIAEILYSSLIKMTAVEKLPSNLKLCININLNRIRTDILEFIKQKNAIIIKYGEKGENGHASISKSSKNWRIFEKEYAQLLEQEAEFNIVKCAYTFDELRDCLLKCGKDLDVVNLTFDEIDILQTICKFENERN